MDPKIVVTEPSSFSSSSPSISGTSASVPSPSLSNTPSDMRVGVSEKTNWGKIGLYIAVAIVLAILGFNIFRYLGNVTDNVSNIFSPLFSFFGKGITSTVKTTIDTSAEGTKGIINKSTSAIDSGLSALENKLNSGVVRNKIDDKTKEPPKDKKGTDKSEGKAVEPPKKMNKKQRGPSPDDSGSRTQNKPSKAGFCYIGEDRGFRSCIRVTENDTCMSGDIFPTKELCINPNLRE